MKREEIPAKEWNVVCRTFSQRNRLVPVSIEALEYDGEHAVVSRREVFRDVTTQSNGDIPGEVIIEVGDAHHEGMYLRIQEVSRMWLTSTPEGEDAGLDIQSDSKGMTIIRLLSPARTYFANAPDALRDKNEGRRRE